MLINTYSKKRTTKLIFKTFTKHDFNGRKLCYNNKTKIHIHVQKTWLTFSVMSDTGQTLMKNYFCTFFEFFSVADVNIYKNFYFQYAIDVMIE